MRWLGRKFVQDASNEIEPQWDCQFLIRTFTFLIICSLFLKKNFERKPTRPKIKQKPSTLFNALMQGIQFSLKLLKTRHIMNVFVPFVSATKANKILQ